MDRLKEGFIDLATVDGKLVSNIKHHLVFWSPEGMGYGQQNAASRELALNICEAILRLKKHMGQQCTSFHNKRSMYCDAHPCTKPLQINTLARLDPAKSHTLLVADVWAGMCKVLYPDNMKTWQHRGSYQEDYVELIRVQCECDHLNIHLAKTWEHRKKTPCQKCKGMHLFNKPNGA